MPPDNLKEIAENGGESDTLFEIYCVLLLECSCFLVCEGVHVWCVMCMCMWLCGVHVYVYVVYM